MLLFSTDKPAEVLLWVDKYKPTVMKSIVGQQGDKSNAKKLLKWLINWEDNHLKGAKPKGKGGIFAYNDGKFYLHLILTTSTKVRFGAIGGCSPPVGER